MTEIKKKEIKTEEVDGIPEKIIGPVEPAYDQAVPSVLAATKDTISYIVDGTTPKQLYSALHPRIAKYNNDQDREYDLLLAQRKSVTYLQRCPKGTISPTEQ